MTTLEILKYVGYFLCITVESFIPCYFGERVVTVSNDLAKAIYNVKWYEQDIRFRKYFVLLLQRAQKEERLMAGNQIPISLRSFYEVIFYNF